MKRKLLTLLALVAATLPMPRAGAQTTIEPLAEVHGRWTLEGSPYLVMGEAIVPKRKTLEIEPGVQVLFKTGEVVAYDSTAFDLGFLRVNGSLVARGTAQAPVRFSRQGEQGNWGIVLVNSSEIGIAFEHCVFEHANKLRRVFGFEYFCGALSLKQSTASIRNCLFVDNLNEGIDCKDGSSPTIESCTFVGNQWRGIFSSSQSHPMVKNSIFWANALGDIGQYDAQVSLLFSLVEKEETQYLATVFQSNIVGQDPKFQDLQARDLRLKRNSPAKAKGETGQDLGVQFD